MISVCIWGLPELNEGDLISLTKDIHRALQPMARDLPSDKPGSYRICVYYQRDLMKYELGTEVLIEIKGCHHDLALANKHVFHTIIDEIKALVDNCQHVECRVQPRTNDIVVSSA